MKPLLRKSIKELQAMSSAEVRAYLQSLKASEQKMVSNELYRAQLRLDTQQIKKLTQQVSE